MLLWMHSSNWRANIGFVSFKLLNEKKYLGNFFRSLGMAGAILFLIRAVNAFSQIDYIETNCSKIKDCTAEGKLFQ
jgi:hypothetical protein